MCKECYELLNLNQENFNLQSDDLHQKVMQLLTLYDRMMVQLSFCLNDIVPCLAIKLQTMEQSRSKVKLGATGLSFVSGALAVAGTATLLTPAGIPLLIGMTKAAYSYTALHMNTLSLFLYSAAMATSGTSSAIQFGNTAFTYTSAKEANQLAERIVGWNGLCLSILAAFEHLRKELIHQGGMIKAQKLKQMEPKKRSGSILNGISRGTSMGLRATSVVGAAGSYSSQYTALMQTSLQMTPFVGAALSLGIMACDAHSIHATIQSLRKQNDVALCLHNIQTTFPLLVPTSVESEALLLLEVIRDLWLLQKVANQPVSSPPESSSDEEEKSNKDDSER
jgi:hypothetical protein